MSPQQTTLTNVLEKLDEHMAAQLMKAAASLSASNALRRAGDSGAGQQ
jgi:hypothetical protein